MSLTLKNITLSFDSVVTLDNISFRVDSGEIVSLIGPSGYGKSTLFSTIGGLLTPDSGEIFLGDKLINSKRGFVAYMPQDASLLPWRTVLENVCLSQELSGFVDTQYAEKMLALAGLEEHKNHYPKALSGGMKQRVSFIRALLTNKDILLLDEPFSALDSFTKESMQEWLLAIYKARKNTLFFITHDIEEAIYLSSKIIIMSSSGKINHILKVPLMYPKDRLSDDFWRFKREIVDLIKQA